MSNMHHMSYLEAVTAADVAHLREKEATYRGSWKKRGGVGAWMMACRKFDRLEGILSQDTLIERGGYNWDIFAAIAADPSGVDGCALAEVRDLRRYLLLIEAEMVSRGIVILWSPPVTLESALPSALPSAPPPATSMEPPKPPLVHRIEDGLSTIDYIAQGVHYWAVTKDFVIYHHIVDRTNEPPEVWEHLPRLALELNHKEWEDTPVEYQPLFKWDGGKWIMADMYRGCWGKQT